ncbi:ABC transporter ATP-binding protein [Nocardioides alkalitolerans]|uniref:ABC transporter ATP-binding protein n=1 Tax=Nocardioides alkalitolerans TaxID=281714 RepID=UPI0003F5141E|nr:ATP-binding cassette domain-containing protein [Nocardioides alkalitolerans]
MSAAELRAARVSARPRGAHRDVLVDVDLAVAAGTTVGLVGRSGAGKSTLVRLLLGLEQPSSGAVTWQDAHLPTRRADRRGFRRAVQYVPQDPLGSLDPRHDVDHLVREPLRCLGVAGDHRQRVAAALAAVDLDPSLGRRRPRELSGGQAQRVAVARALATGPSLLVADEPLSAVDRPLRDELVDLLSRLHHERGLGLLLVSHDLGAVARLCGTTVVLDAGRAVESGATDQLLHEPRHPATRALVEAAPRLDGRAA